MKVTLENIAFLVVVFYLPTVVIARIGKYQEKRIDGR